MPLGTIVTFVFARQRTMGKKKATERGSNTAGLGEYLPFPPPALVRVPRIPPAAQGMHHGAGLSLFMLWDCQHLFVFAKCSLFSLRTLMQARGWPVRG